MPEFEWEMVWAAEISRLCLWSSLSDMVNVRKWDNRRGWCPIYWLGGRPLGEIHVAGFARVMNIFGDDEEED